MIIRKVQCLSYFYLKYGHAEDPDPGYFSQRCHLFTGWITGSILDRSKPVLGPSQPPVQCVPWALTPEEKQPVRETNN
jgi:hypothetical protein